MVDPSDVDRNFILCFFVTPSHESHICPPLPIVGVQVPIAIVYLSLLNHDHGNVLLITEQFMCYCYGTFRHGG